VRRRKHRPGDCCSATCQYETAGTSCDDGNVCTEYDECDGVGTCSGDLRKPCEVPALNPWGQLFVGLLVLASGLGLVSQRKRHER